MVARFNPCCTRIELRAVLAGRPAAADDSQIESHLEECEGCRQELERLAAGQKWWEGAHSYLSDDGQADNIAACDQALCSSERIDLDATSGLNVAPHDRARKHAEILSLLPQGLLQSSDDPAKIGCIGPYEVVEAIGRGGMGVVLKAFDPALSRYVAIKVLAAELAHNASARRRFAREAQAAAAVVHDHVVPIYAVDATGAMPYLVMAYIPGRSLQERIDETGPLDVREILRIGMQTASGLAAAHAQGLVHRDIKPANILLENGVERVRITDFGLARAMDEASQTQSGVLAGTPQYMAPEQALGEAIDCRTDLFSLGSVLYAMCTGHSPFRAETTVAVLRRICDGRQRPLREVNADVPDWLADIVDRLLSKRPGDRYGSADEVARTLAEHLAQVQHPPRPHRPLRHRLVTWIVAAAAVVAVTVVLALLGNRANQGEADARKPAPAQVSAANAGPPAKAGTHASTTVPAINQNLGQHETETFEGELRALNEELDRLERSSSRHGVQGFRFDAIRMLDEKLNGLEGEIGNGD